MSSEGLSISFAGLPVRLLPSGAVLCEQSSTLFVADVHLGKAASFRQLGQPVPKGTTSATLARLTRDISAYSIRHLVVLGDLFHNQRMSSSIGTMTAIARWRQMQTDCQITLVRGNHDLGLDSVADRLTVDLVEQPFGVGAFQCCHDLAEAQDPGTKGILAGHVHPVVVLRGLARDRVRLPCFVVTESTLLLPAYGSFTGGYEIKRRPGQTCYVLADTEVFKLPGPA